MSRYFFHIVSDYEHRAITGIVNVELIEVKNMLLPMDNTYKMK